MTRKSRIHVGREKKRNFGSRWEMTESRPFWALSVIWRPAKRLLFGEGSCSASLRWILVVRLRSETRRDMRCCFVKNNGRLLPTRSFTKIACVFQVDSSKIVDLMSGYSSTENWKDRYFFKQVSILHQIKKAKPVKLNEILLLEKSFPNQVHHDVFLFYTIFPT